ncbi:hypothetical protein HELRODRAFT_171319 [Helobdella robusta]|uniref:Uncharacterized protein n=1 Tax=Helobdella robusta TaxID=6412 RepID=T1F438_HELRO|nr:hypothetical protein HELRODRAFT_171319 [Helobdella robusta]ESO05661.1 hypothetical protein HELRODRAFT_171319 [Helobdella robusta]
MTPTHPRASHFRSGASLFLIGGLIRCGGCWRGCWSGLVAENNDVSFRVYSLKILICVKNGNELISQKISTSSKVSRKSSSHFDESGGLNKNNTNSLMCWKVGAPERDDERRRGGRDSVASLILSPTMAEDCELADVS